ncbi:hypothetical protein CRD60_03400 [Bifidobacterium aemilianum]|uniref:Major facilitator superfamily (MFS) profile domain-containing protein n=1 Tax=Bifidobacterium aemilianum TaxID=2493120 RepID=A0A366KAL7_9BIFI|nr:MFS transporter [Bifidobacterium aemilianum]RBP98198.1 hypothetical protein CRD60_03400 [Bifidobacterium aemilianum]
MRWLREFMGLPAFLRAMLIIDLICSFGIGLVMPIELLFTTHSLGASISEANLTVTVSSVGSLICHPLVGWLSDKKSPWLALHLTLVLSVVGPLLFAFAQTFTMALIAALVSGMGMSMYTAWTSILTQVSTEEQHKIVYGINQAEVNLGIGLGAAVGGLLVVGGSDFYFRLGFAGRAIGYAIVALALLIVQRHYGLTGLKASKPVTPIEVPAQSGFQEADGQKRKGIAGIDRQVLTTMILLTVGTLFMDIFGYAQFDSGMVTTLISDPHIPSWSLSLVDTVNTFGLVIINVILLPRLKDGNHVLMLRTVPIFWALGWTVIVLGLRFDSPAMALATACLGGLIFCFGEVMLGISQPVVAAELAGPRFSGRMFGLLNTAGSTGYILGPLFSSFVLDGHQPIPLLTMCSIGLVLLAFPWFLAIKTSHRNPEIFLDGPSTGQADRRK